MIKFGFRMSTFHWQIWPLGVTYQFIRTEITSQTNISFSSVIFISEYDQYIITRPFYTGGK
jgi:hypothetical protein